MTYSIPLICLRFRLNNVGLCLVFKPIVLIPYQSGCRAIGHN